MIQDKNATPRKSALVTKLDPGEIKSGGSGGILSSMFRTILLELGINDTRWNHLMNRFIADPRNCIPANTRDQSSARGNLQKELLKKEMSWKVLIKGIRFLNVIKFDVIIRLHHANGKITEHHSKTISLKSVDDEKEQDV